MNTFRINPYGCCAVSLVILFFYIYFMTDPEPTLLDGSGISIKRLLSLSIHLAQLSGKEIVKIHNEKIPLDIKLKDSPSISLSSSSSSVKKKEILTIADLRSNEIIVNTLHDWMPDLQVISEEKSSTKKLFNKNKNNKEDDDDDSERIRSVVDKELFMNKDVDEIVSHDMLVSSRALNVWIDPLDATKEFSENLLSFVSVMIGITLNERVIAGVIYFPFTNTTYWAWKGYGISPSLQILINQRQEKEEKFLTKIIISQSHTGNTENIALNTFGPKSQIIKAGGSGYKAIELIKGNADVYLHSTIIKKWDLCAPHAILTALQSVVVDGSGQPISYNARDLKKRPEMVIVENGFLATFSKKHLQTYLKQNVKQQQQEA